MGIPRLVRVNELLKREIAEDLYRHFSMTDFDAAALTVTRVECASDLRDANVFEVDRDKRDDFVANFRGSGFKMRGVFTDVAAYCRGG